MSNARAVLGAGLVSLDLWDPDAQLWSGFEAPVDADKFEIKPNFEEKVSVSKSHLDYGQARASVVLPSPTEITIDIAAANAKAFAMQFQGAVAALNQAAATVTDEAIASAKVGENKLANRNIVAAGFVVENTAGTTTYVMGTDYEVNYALGILIVKSGGAIVPGAGLNVSYSALAVSATRILGGRNPQVRCRARFVGKNMVDGSPLEADVHEAVLGASNAFDFLAADFVAIQLSGKIVTPPGKTEGYEVRVF